MNLKRVVTICILITITAAAILIYKVMQIETDIVRVETEPIPIAIYLPQIIGAEPEIAEVKTLMNQRQVMLLANLIDLEAGSDYCTDELQQAVGSVVLNRVADDRFPNTLEGVIYQPGQYSTAGQIATNKPSERSIANAEYLIANGSTLPEEVLFQANFKIGKTYTIMQGVYFGK